MSVEMIATIICLIMITIINKLLTQSACIHFGVLHQATPTNDSNKIVKIFQQLKCKSNNQQKQFKLSRRKTFYLLSPG